MVYREIEVVLEVLELDHKELMIMDEELPNLVVDMDNAILFLEV